MKKIVTYVVLAVLILTGILLFNTFRATSKQLKNIPPAPELVVSDSAISHFAQALRYRTVSNMDITQIDSAQFDQFLAYLEKTYPLVHTKLSLEKVNSYSLLFKWQGKNAALKPAILMGHYDVVPVIQGTEKLWEHKPFDGDYTDGYLYGRGTLDDKVSVMGILEAVEQLLREGYQPERSFYLSFGHDEEVSGPNGGQRIAALLESRNIQAEYVMDEGGMVKTDGIPGLNKMIAFVGIAEKGYTTLQLTATGEGGHSSMPPPQTSIGMLAEAIDKVQKNPFPARLDGAISNMQDYLAPEMPLGMKLVLSNKWLLKPLIISSLAKTPVGNATVRTTTAPTIVDAGIKDNVLPIEATAKINFRILPGDSVEGIVNQIRKTINNDQVKVESMKEFDCNPSIVSDTASFGFRLIQRTVMSCFPNAIVAPSLVVGGTDSRYFHRVTPNIYRFIPSQVSDSDIKRVHGTNERINGADFKNAIRFYRELIKGS